MSASVERSSRRVPGVDVPRALPWLGVFVSAVTLIAGLAIKAATGALGTPLPPLVVSWRPAVDPLGIVSVSAIIIAAVLAPRLLFSVRPRSAFAIGLYALAVILGLSLNLAHGGVHGWWSVFAGAREARFEYLPGLSALRHGTLSYVGHFAQLVPSLPLHAAGNPPGPLVVMHVLGIDTPGRLAASCIVVGGFTAPLAYQLGREIGGEERGRTAGCLTAFTPSLLVFGVTSADYAFAAMGLGVACLLVRPTPRARLAGAVFAAVASLFSWLLLAIPAWAVLLALRREGIRRGLVLAAFTGAAVIAVNVALALSTGYDPIATVRATEAVYRRTTAARPYAYWVFGSPVAWALALGLPTAMLCLRAVATSDPAAAALGVVVIVSAILGFTKGETERIWLAFTPLACVAAAAVLPRRRLAAVVWALSAQALAFELLFNTIW